MLGLRILGIIGYLVLGLKTSCTLRMFELQMQALLYAVRHIPWARGPSHELSCMLCSLLMYSSNCWFSWPALSSECSCFSLSISTSLASASASCPCRFSHTAWPWMCLIFLALCRPASSSLLPSFWFPVRHLGAVLTCIAFSGVRSEASSAWFALHSSPDSNRCSSICLQISMPQTQTECAESPCFATVACMPKLRAKKLRMHFRTCGCFCAILRTSENPPHGCSMQPSASKKPAKYSQLHGPAIADSYFFRAPSLAFKLFSLQGLSIGPLGGQHQLLLLGDAVWCTEQSCSTGRLAPHAPPKSWLAQTHAAVLASGATTEGRSEDQNFCLIERLGNPQPGSGQICSAGNAAIPTEEAGQISQPAFCRHMGPVLLVGSKAASLELPSCQQGRGMADSWPRA